MALVGLDHGGYEDGACDPVKGGSKQNGASIRGVRGNLIGQEGWAIPDEPWVG
jgi:hypothetical protein